VSYQPNEYQYKSDSAHTDEMKRIFLEKQYKDLKNVMIRRSRTMTSLLQPGVVQSIKCDSKAIRQPSMSLSRYQPMVPERTSCIKARKKSYFSYDMKKKNRKSLKNEKLLIKTRNQSSIGYTSPEKLILMPDRLDNKTLASQFH
jgi:hypothetical protein